MAGGVIHVNGAKGDVLFLSPEGKEVLKPSKNVTVKLDQEFPGMTISEAIMEAKKFAVGALQQRVAEKMRGFKCQAVARNVDVQYRVKYGFQGQKPPRSH
jgi:hypothetical protein